MYSIIICAVIGLLIGLCIRECQFLLTILGATIGCIAALFGGIVVNPDTVPYTETYEIVSINDNSGLSGWYMAMTPAMNFAMYIKTSEGSN